MAVLDELDAGPVVDDPTPNTGEYVHMMDGGVPDYDSPSDFDRLFLAVDFGTTFSSVAYATVRRGEWPAHLGLGDVASINRYPDYVPPTGAPCSREDVPTELWYGTEPRESLKSSEGWNEADEPVNQEEYTSMYPSSDEEDRQDESEESSSEESSSEVESLKDMPASETPSCWGFGIQNQLSDMNRKKDGERRLSRFKLLLDDSPATNPVRKELAPTLKALKRLGLIERDEDIFTHYFTHLLQNAKDQLKMQGAWTRDTRMEFVLCVPPKWSTKSSRILQTAMRSAVKIVGFGENADNDVCNLFIVSEPEAAAACVLAEHEGQLYCGEVVAVIDAGGGTIDTATYEIANEEPLRLNAEVVRPDSELQGASFINERFKKHLMKRLENESKDLEKNGKTIESIVEAKVVVFENGEKRRLDTTDVAATLEPIWIDDLKADARKAFLQNKIVVQHEQIKWIFQDSLRGARTVLWRQLNAADEKEKPVHMVIGTGGFIQSPALQNYLKIKLQGRRNNDGSSTGFLTSRSPSTAIARGAVLRALTKGDGPRRISQCSYGFLRTEPYEPNEYPAHGEARPKIDKADGERYIDGTIDWIVNVGDEIESGHEVPFKVKHSFTTNQQRLVCKEQLWVSDQRHKSHYRKNHPNNNGAELAGSIVVDMTFLITKGLIEPVQPSEFSTKDHRKANQCHFDVYFDLVAITEGRTLRYEARWPPGDKLSPGEEQKMQARGQTCIAAAFQPGTA